MKWTKETPTKPGAYWWRLNKETDHIRCVREVFSTRRGSLLERASDRHPIYLGGEWCGPLLPSEEVEKVYKDGYREAYEAASETCSTAGPGHLESAWISYRARRVVEGEEV